MSVVRRLGSSFLILLASRVVGLARELLISVAFGFSRITDAFYQASFVPIAVQTVTNGPFTTAFAARLAAAPIERRGAHLRHYMRVSARIGVGLAVVTAAAAFGLRRSGGTFGETLFLPLLVLSPAIAGTLTTGYVYAVATAVGRIATAAATLFVSNAVLVAAIAAHWAAGLPLETWTLPAFLSGATLLGTAFALRVLREILAELDAAAGTASPPAPLAGLGVAFLLAGLETAFFLLTQSVVLALASTAGAGWASAASVVQRIVFSVNGLIVGPIASLTMLRVLEDRAEGRRRFVRTAVGVGLGLALFGGLVAVCGPLALDALVAPTSSRHASAVQVAALLPAFALWLVPLGTNVVVCRVMFGLGLERLYTVSTVTAYAAANLVRAGVSISAGLAPAIAAGALVELACVVFLVARTRHHLLRSRKST